MNSYEIVIVGASSNSSLHDAEIVNQMLNFESGCQKRITQDSIILLYITYSSNDQYSSLLTGNCFCIKKLVNMNLFSSPNFLYTYCLQYVQYTTNNMNFRLTGEVLLFRMYIYNNIIITISMYMCM